MKVNIDVIQHVTQALIRTVTENKPKVLPTVSMLLAVGSSVVYGCKGDWRRMIYWLAASVLTASVTY